MKHIISATAVVALLAGTAPAFAAANLLTNGDFSQETIANSNGVQTAVTQSAQLNASGSTGWAASNPYNSGATVTGWTNSGYSFLFVPGAGTSGTTADTTGASPVQYGSTPLTLSGPGNGTNNGLKNDPTGGNFIASDGAYSGPISQVVNNLVVGNYYLLSFYWAAAEQSTYSKPSTESWSVSFGNDTYNTATVSTPASGFSPWVQQQVSFIATSTTQTLSFLAAGSPMGAPPFSLLASVNLQVPEPSTWASLVAGLGALGLMGFMRRRNNNAA